MAKIRNITIIDGTYEVTYESGTVRTFDAIRLPATAHEWLDENMISPCKAKADDLYWSDWDGKRIPLTAEEVAWFREMAAGYLMAAGVNVPVYIRDFDRLRADNRSVGMCVTENPDDIMAGHPFILIDAYHIHEHWLNVQKDFPLVGGFALGNTIAHEIAHLTYWDHSPAHGKLTVQIMDAYEAMLEAQQEEAPAPAWEVLSLYAAGETYYQVARVIDESQPRHSGNFEWGGVFDEKEEAQARADELNGVGQEPEEEAQADTGAFTMTETVFSPGPIPPAPAWSYICSSDMAPWDQQRENYLAFEDMIRTVPAWDDFQIYMTFRRRIYEARDSREITALDYRALCRILSYAMRERETRSWNEAFRRPMDIETTPLRDIWRYDPKTWRIIYNPSSKGAIMYRTAIDGDMPLRLGTYENEESALVAIDWIRWCMSQGARSCEVPTQEDIDATLRGIVPDAGLFQASF